MLRLVMLSLLAASTAYACSLSVDPPVQLNYSVNSHICGDSGVAVLEPVGCIDVDASNCYKVICVIDTMDAGNVE
jgi:hypothetical protein